ncbi:LacI family DNA-binding transcriptional regulator [Anaerosporobacter sp.]
MAKSVKLADLAAVLKVSTVTVSKALSNQKGVSDELRERIKKLAVEMGYRHPSTIKKADVSGGYNIGIIIADKFLEKFNSFYWQMYQGVTTKVAMKNCFSMLEVISESDEENNILPKLIQEQKVNGIIVIGKMKDEYLKMIKEVSTLPTVYMDFYDDKQSCDAVISNSYLGSYVLTNYLIDMGHKKIGFVGTVLATDSITDRYFGFTKAMMEHGLTIKPEWLVEDRDTKTGKVEIDSKKLIVEEMPTAYVCNCDLTASYVIKCLEANGLSVPKDVSVVGFDNYLYPGLCDIGITTYEVDIHEMARFTVSTIIKKIENKNYKSGIFIGRGHLVCKESVIHV